MQNQFFLIIEKIKSKAIKKEQNLIIIEVNFNDKIVKKILKHNCFKKSSKI